MRRALLLLVCWFAITSSAKAQFPDGTPPEMRGGLMIIRQGGVTTWSLGGVLLPRAVKQVTRTPDGTKEYTRFKMPSMMHIPQPIPFLDAAPATIQVEVPDRHALLYVDGELVRTHGQARQLESPPLAPGKSYPVRVRTAFVIGDRFYVEEKEVTLRAGQQVAINFDGAQAVSVALPRDTPPVAAIGQKR
jgi:uncharacterized protein (TIGR03000 family)